MHTKDDDIYLYPVSCLFFSIFVVFYVRVIKRRYSEHFVRNRSAGRRGPDVVPGKSRIECVLSNTTESPNDKALLQWNNADQRTNERPTCFRPEKKRKRYIDISITGAATTLLCPCSSFAARLPLEEGAANRVPLVVHRGTSGSNDYDATSNMVVGLGIFVGEIKIRRKKRSDGSARSIRSVTGCGGN